MKKQFIAVAIVGAIAASVFILRLRAPEAEVEQAATDFTEPQAGAIVFDMKYRSLSGGKDEL